MAGRWLGPGNRTFLEVASMVATLWIVAFLHSVSYWCCHPSHTHSYMRTFIANPRYVLFGGGGGGYFPWAIFLTKGLILK